MNDFVKLVTLLATMSVAVERAVEILKGSIKWLNTPLPAASGDNKRRAVLQCITVVIGTITAYLAQGQINNINAAKDILDLKFYAGYLVFGLLTAGGSAFWNHVLDIIGALKTQQENAAKTTAPAAAAPAPAPAPAAAAAAAGGGK